MELKDIVGKTVTAVTDRYDRKVGMVFDDGSEVEFEAAGPHRDTGPTQLVTYLTEPTVRPDEPLEIYRERNFIWGLDAPSYLERQAGSAVWLAELYREWLEEEPNEEVAKLVARLARMHDRQATQASGEKRESYYMKEMYRRLGVKLAVTPRLRLLVHGVMYLRGLQRYELIAVKEGSPYDVWIEDARRSADECLATAARVHPDQGFAVLAKVIEVEADLMREVEMFKGKPDGAPVTAEGAKGGEDWEQFDYHQ